MGTLNHTGSSERWEGPKRGFCRHSHPLKQASTQRRWEFPIGLGLCRWTSRTSDTRRFSSTVSCWALRAKTLMQLLRLVLRPLLHLRLSCFFFFFFFKPKVCVAKAKTKLSQGEKCPHCAVCSSGRSWRRKEKKQRRLFASGRPQLELGRRRPLNSHPRTSQPVPRQSAAHPKASPCTPNTLTVNREREQRADCLPIVLFFLSTFWQI